MCAVNLDMLWWRLLRWRNFRFSFVAYLPVQFWFSDSLTFKMNFTFLIPISRFWTDRFGIDIFVWYFWQLCSAWSPSRDEDCFLHFLYKKRFYKIQDKMQEIRDNPIKKINKKRKKLIFWGYSVDDKFVKHASFRIRNQIFPYNLLLLTSFSVPCPLLGSSPVAIWPPRCHIHPPGSLQKGTSYTDDGLPILQWCTWLWTDCGLGLLQEKWAENFVVPSSSI